MSHKFLASIMVVLVIAACAPAVPGPLPTSSAIAPADIPVFIPTVTPQPSTTAASQETQLPSQTPASWKEGWVDFTNGYYGYTISIPASAVVHKNEQIDSYDPNDLPAGWDENDNYFDYLNMTYPPGTCVSIQYGSASINIKAADDLGGKYAMHCGSFGGLGVANWVWTEEQVTVAETTYTATVVRACDAQNQNCEPGTYGIQIGGGVGFVLFNVDPSNKDVLFEILRSYRPAQKTELYCPEPAPTRLIVGEYAFVNTDPPLAHNNVRSAPGINQELIGKIAPGEAFKLLEGPVCNNSLQWWQVQVSKSGLVGWTPEGDHKFYWVNPCNSPESCGALE